MQLNILYYLIKNSDEYASSHIKLMKFDLGAILSFYGEHFSSPKEGYRINKFKENVLIDYPEFFTIKFFKKSEDLNRKKVLSSEYSLWNERFKEMGVICRKTIMES
tara:strand:+ start:788 stop:1105 length:318 start_codon:yes stop_codon:yes gene_type:complete